MEFNEKLKQLQLPVDVKNIDFRVQAVTGSQHGHYARILAYKDARFDMHILDAVMGPENWQRKHECINNVIYCSVGIYNPETQTWVWKQDAGTESQQDADKGAASDSFKRACFNWGIGRELYDFPEIMIKLEEGEWTEREYNGKKIKSTSWSFKLKSFVWGIVRDKETQDITILGCRDKDGKVRFSYKKEVKNG